MTAGGARLDPAARREMLVEVAERILATTEPTKVTLQHLADAAGVSRPLVYAYFRDRAGLLAAVERRRAETVDEALAAAVAGSPHPDARAHALIEAAEALGVRARSVFLADRPEHGPRFARLAAALGVDPDRADMVGGVVLGAILAAGDPGTGRVAEALGRSLSDLLEPVAATGDGLVVVSDLDADADAGAVLDGGAAPGGGGARAGGTPSTPPVQGPAS